MVERLSIVLLHGFDSHGPQPVLNQKMARASAARPTIAILEGMDANDLRVKPDRESDDVLLVRFIALVVQPKLSMKARKDILELLFDSISMLRAVWTKYEILGATTSRSNTACVSSNAIEERGMNLAEQ